LSLRKPSLIVFVFLAIASLSSWAYLDFYYSRNSPKEPQPETGRVRRNLVNKTYVYLSSREEMAQQLLFESFVLWFALVLCFGVRWNLMRLPAKEQKLPATYKRK
jgi:hypothetical protein